MLFDILKSVAKESPKVNKIEIFTDFRGHYYIYEIHEGTDHRYSNYELFKTEYENLWSQDVIVDLPELKPSTRYELKFGVNTDWDYTHTECEIFVYYIKGSLKELK